MVWVGFYQGFGNLAQCRALAFVSNQHDYFRQRISLAD